MLTLLSITMLGFFLGMRHATDPDHVVAVTTIVSRERTVIHAMAIGALWGMGHTFTILLVGSAMILFRLKIPPRIGLGMELTVGFMLILLGVLNLTGLMQLAMEWISTVWPGSGMHSHFIMGRQMVHTHSEDSDIISDNSFSLPGWTVIPEELPLARQEEELGPTFSSGGATFNAQSWQLEPGLSQCGLQVEPAPVFWRRLSVFHVVRPLMVGIVHGLAGSAAVALLVLSAISQPKWAIGYLFVFGMGTVAGMMMITMVIALPFAYSLRHFTRINSGLAMATGFVSVAFGLYLCYQIGFVDGFFTGHPNWIPR
jgi:high-affinity nickel permease